MQNKDKNRNLIIFIEYFRRREHKSASKNFAYAHFFREILRKHSIYNSFFIHSMLTSIIVAVFFLGYLCITLEDVLKVNKAAVALLMCVICWVLYTTGAAQYLSAEVLQSIGDGSVAQYVSEHSLREHLGEITETLFFLMGAMTVVEVIDTNGGFNFVRDALDTRSKRALLWKISFITFFLSAVLDTSPLLL